MKKLLKLFLMLTFSLLFLVACGEKGKEEAKSETSLPILSENAPRFHPEKQSPESLFQDRYGFAVHCHNTDSVKNVHQIEDPGPRANHT